MLMPTPNPIVVAQGVLSYFPSDDKKTTRAERVAVIIPVFNEEKEIYQTIHAVLAQTRLPNLLVISENGSRDRTREIIRGCLTDHNVTHQGSEEFQGARVTKYAVGICEILLIEHDKKTGKAISMNFAKPLMHRHDIQRVIAIDSDTRLTPTVIQRLMDDFYVIRCINHSKYEIHERCLVGGIVESKKEQGTGIVGELTHRARCAIHDSTEYLLRGGENKTAGLVMPGCCYSVALDDLVIPERTVTEDMDFTWKMQVAPERCRPLTLQDVREMGFLVNGKPLADLLERKGQRSIKLVKTSKVYYDIRAVAHTPTPGTMKGLQRQLDRWTYGFIQSMILHNGRLFKNIYLATLVFVGLMLGLWGSIITLAIPAVLLADFLTGNDTDYLRTGALIVAAQVALYGVFIFFGSLRRHRTLGRTTPKAILHAFHDMTLTLGPACVYGWFHSFILFTSTIRGLMDVIRGRMNAYDGTWVRPTDRVSYESTK
jgi:cellulose synthase/poly-beta-1,6-N-acetylglucosamine synthase-like glycosyltransferase